MSEPLAKKPRLDVTASPNGELASNGAAGPKVAGASAKASPPSRPASASPPSRPASASPPSRPASTKPDAAGASAKPSEKDLEPQRSGSSVVRENRSSRNEPPPPAAPPQPTSIYLDPSLPSVFSCTEQDETDSLPVFLKRRSHDFAANVTNPEQLFDFFLDVSIASMSNNLTHTKGVALIEWCLSEEAQLSFFVDGRAELLGGEFEAPAGVGNKGNKNNDVLAKKATFVDALFAGCFWHSGAVLFPLDAPEGQRSAQKQSELWVAALVKGGILTMSEGEYTCF